MLQNRFVNCGDVTLRDLLLDNTIGSHYRIEMIISWANSETAEIWQGNFVRKFPQDIQRTAKRKLVHVHSAKVIEDLKIPPGNRLEKLSGAKKEYWSIRINDQWRICFKWDNGNAFEVKIEDYH